MIAFLAARRKLNAKKVEPTVQELNEQQENAQKKETDEKDVNEGSKSGSCAIVFAVSIMFLIVSAICFIPALVDGSRVFYVAAGALAGIGSALLTIGCCFIDCFRKKGNKGRRGSDDLESIQPTSPPVDFNGNLSVDDLKSTYINPLVPSLIEDTRKPFTPIRQYCNLPTVCT